MGLKKRLRDAAPKLRAPAVIAYAVLLAAVLTGVILFVVYRDDIDNRTLSGFFDLFRFGKSESEAAEIRFDSGGRNIYALCGERFVVLSPERFAFYGFDGIEKMSGSLMYEQPALCVSGGKAVIYDRLGTGCVVADGKNIVARPEGPVTAAAGNGRGGYALVTSDIGYRAVATVYGENDKPYYRVYSSESYIMALGLSPSGGRMTVGAVRQNAENAETVLTFYFTDSETPVAQVVLTGELPLSVTYPDNTHVCVVTEKGAYFYTEEGKALGSYDFGDNMLLGLYQTAEVMFILTGRYENGIYGRLCCVGYEGGEKSAQYFEEAPMALSAAGRYCSAIVSGRIITYDSSGNVVREYSGRPDAQRLCQRADGFVVAIGPESAELIPLDAE